MSFNLQEAVLGIQDPDEALSIEHEIDVINTSEAEISGYLESAIDAVATSSDSILNPHVFDIFQSLLKHLPAVSVKAQSKLLDTILSALQNEIDATTRSLESDDPSAHLAHKMPLEMYAYLLQWFIIGAEKVQGKGDDEAGPAGKKKKAGSKNAANKKGEKWSWVGQIPTTLSLMGKALRLKTDRIWTTTQERDAFINCFTRPAYQIAENEVYMKAPEIKLGIYKVICLSVKFHGHAFGAQTSIIQALQYFEHLSEPMAELLAILTREFDYNQLTEEVLREISTRNFNAQDTKGPRSFSRFLLKITELTPQVVLKQISLLLTHLDSESYPIRMAIVEVIGHLIRHLSFIEDMDPSIKGKQIENFWALLTARFLDTNSWVRTKVITTVTKLLELEIKFTKQRPLVTELAIRHLEDKSASVRRYAIALVTRLVTTHPFGMLYGGDLNLPLWEERYQKAADELAAVEEIEMRNAPQGLEGVDGGNLEDENEDEDEQGENEDAKMNDTEEASPKQAKKEMIAQAAAPTGESIDPNLIIKLRLTKKYHAEALRLIKQIEAAIPKLNELLVSTGRAEVLEAMDFFKVAHEYKFESADLGIKTMLHLIWTKDNNAVDSEDGKELKGIRARVIECYKTLYFDVVADLSPKQQVSRIARHMIELTYNATLAELTSLEELMRAMMADDLIHPDVIAKLWQVYNADQDIPRPQRRGAIIILGMLAVARREIVTERVDLLLKIGLGPLGKADLVLARYTCVALQRVSGSVKKVKGSLSDKSNRLPMDNPIFQRLEDVIKHPASSLQWFGVAEQALNTIYLLGEKPDVLAGAIIKALTVRVFSPEKSSAKGESLSTDGAEDLALEGDADEAVAADVAKAINRLGLEDAPKNNEGDVEDVDDEFAMDEDAVSAAVVDGDGEAKPTHSRSGSGGSAPLLSSEISSSFELGQLVFVVGHVAMKHIVYLELVERELKRRKEEQAARIKAAGTAGKSSKDDLDQVSGNAEDDIGDNMAFIRESELLFSEDSLLTVYGPLIAEICANPTKYKDPALRTAAVLSLSKLMCVSSQFCETYLPLLFRIFETAKEPIIRSNIVIALGDVAVCFSNMIDENSDRLYQGLTDPDIHVKKNTLMVLTHLILNGMIKVKGQLGEMAKCIEDEDQRIRDLARLFFSQLSTKDNALYNNLQDVISHLSVGKHAVDEATFEKTMQYIFTFIEKEKQAESIIEKLCQRFRLATDERQWRDIAFCLSLLPYKSERSVKKLIDGLPFYQDKLHEEVVFKRFSEILAKSRLNKLPNKPESELNEFEAILEAHRRAGEEGQELDAEVAKKQAASAKRKAATTAGKRGGGRQAAAKSTPVPKRSTRKKRVVESSDEDEEESDGDDE